MLPLPETNYIKGSDVFVPYKIVDISEIKKVRLECFNHAWVPKVVMNIVYVAVCVNIYFFICTRLFNVCTKQLLDSLQFAHFWHLISLLIYLLAKIRCHEFAIDVNLTRFDVFLHLEVLCAGLLAIQVSV